jgi:Transposase Tn5 dimerisation domain/Transposase DNA-binding
MQAWIEMETKGTDFGDQRLDARYQVLLEQLSDKPSLSIPAACGGQAETAAAYRFFDNEKTDAGKVLEPHRHATLERIRAEAVVIAAQDTTEIDLTRKQEKVGGPLNDMNRWGMYVHPVLVMTPQRVPLGVVDAKMWSRDPQELEKTSKERRKERRQKPFAEKESYRWLAGYEAACQIAVEAPDTKVVCVSDSEGDIYECFLAGAREDAQRAEWIVRAGQADRTLAEEEKNLRQLLACQTPLGKMTVEVSKREASTGDGRKRRQPRASRQADVTVRSVRTLLSPPSRAGETLPPVYVNAILVCEEKPPEGEEPIEWLLVTSLPIATFAEACTVVSYYCCRWEIEVFFRVLKSGCKIEELQFHREDRLNVCLAMYLIVAWRVLYVLKMGRECPEMSCDAVFSEAEWKSVYVIANQKAAPKKPPTLAQILPMIAGLGGYLGRKHDGPPGPKTMWIGLQRMRDFATAWATFGPAAAKSCV